MRFAVIILTFNEEENLPICLTSLRGLSCDLFVVDSGSTDRTIEIARSFEAEIVYHQFDSHSAQWQWALDHLPLRTEWVLGLDADQSLSRALHDELLEIFTVGGESDILKKFNGLYINRAHIFRGRFIRHGGCYPKYMLKLFRRSGVYLDPTHDLLDHHFYVHGPTGKLRHQLIEENRKEWDISFWIRKHVRYAAQLADEEFNWHESSAVGPLAPKLVGGSPDQRILALKELWRKMPLYVRPGFYFLFRYFMRWGFLDGKQGFIFHFLHAFWFRLLVDIKLDELKTGSPNRAVDIAAASIGKIVR